jgi:hypothetical protein
VGHRGITLMSPGQSVARTTPSGLGKARESGPGAHGKPARMMIFRPSLPTPLSSKFEAPRWKLTEVWCHGLSDALDSYMHQLHRDATPRYSHSDPTLRTMEAESVASELSVRYPVSSLLRIWEMRLAHLIMFARAKCDGQDSARPREESVSACGEERGRERVWRSPRRPKPRGKRGFPKFLYGIIQLEHGGGYLQVSMR